MRISVEADIKEATKFLTHTERRQIPFAASQALNAVARTASMKELRTEADRTFQGGATGFTKRGFRYKKSHKRNLVAFVLVNDEQAEYMKFQVDGGTRLPKRKKLLARTYKTKLNRYGNMTQSTVKKMFNDKSKFFSGKPKGIPSAGEGIWERYGRKTKRGGQRIRMVATYLPNAQYKPLFPFVETTEGVVFSRTGKGFKAQFEKFLEEAVRTMKV